MSGVLLYHNVVLTAACNVVDRGKRVFFSRAVFGGEAGRESPVERCWVPEGYFSRGVDNYALAFLKDPVGEVGLAGLPESTSMLP